MNAVFEQAAAEGIGVYFASGDDGDNQAAAGQGVGRLPRLEPVGDVGRRHEPRDRRAAAATSGSPAGARPRPTGTARGGRPKAPATSCTDPAAGRATCSRCRPTRWASCPRRSRPGRASRGAPSRTSRWTPTPRPGVTFAQTYVLPNGRRRIIDSWIGGTSLAAPLAAGVMALSDQWSRHPHGFVNPALYAARRHARAARRHRRPRVDRGAAKRAPARRLDRRPGCARSTATARSPRRPAGIP